jgi:hypothetical protein
MTVNALARIAHSAERHPHRRLPSTTVTEDHALRMLLATLARHRPDLFTNLEQGGDG